MILVDRIRSAGSVARRDQSGVAVLTVLLAVVLLLILSSALFLTTRLALERAAQTTDSTRALNVAESGIETAANAIVTQGFEAGDVGTIEGSLAGGGDYEVVWEAPTALPWFDMTATGYHANRTEATGVRSITAQTFALNPWDFQFAGGMVGNTVNGNVWVQGPFYVNDELLMSGTAGVHEGPLIIRDTMGDGDGDLILDSASADIGSVGNPVPLFIDGSVTKKKEPQNYYVDPFYNWAPELEFPDLGPEDLPYYYYGMSPTDWESDVEAPMAVWDSDSSIDGSTALTFDDKTTQMLPTDSSMRRDGTRVDWDYTESGNTTTLTIKFDNSGDGTHDEIRPILFVDGNLTIEASNKFQVRYEGKGTIIANGKISVKGDLVPTGSTLGSDLADTNLNDVFPVNNRLGLITLGDLDYEGHTDEWLAAALYSGGTLSFSRQGNFLGSAVTGALNLGEQVPHLYTQPNFSNNLPPRMPGGDTRITSIIGWSETTPP